MSLVIAVSAAVSVTDFGLMESVELVHHKQYAIPIMDNARNEASILIQGNKVLLSSDRVKD